MTKNKKQNRESKRKGKKTILEKKMRFCLLFPNFKPESNQTKTQKFLKLFSL
jgi:hypothetical protein